MRIKAMRRVFLVIVLSAFFGAACAPYNGGNQPAGAPATPAPSVKVTPVGAPAGTPMPTGNPDVDNYGY